MRKIKIDFLRTSPRSHSDKTNTSPQATMARLTRTLSNSGVRQNRQVLPGTAECSERKGETP